MNATPFRRLLALLLLAASVASASALECGPSQVLGRTDYDAFGVLIDRTGATDNAFLYCGERWDANLGFYYLRARYMNPGTGRFWTMDSFEGSRFDPLTLHLYLYANADPVGAVDPSGRGALALSAVSTGSVVYTLQSAFMAMSAFYRASSMFMMSVSQVASFGAMLTSMTTMSVGGLGLGFSTDNILHMVRMGTLHVNQAIGLLGNEASLTARIQMAWAAHLNNLNWALNNPYEQARNALGQFMSTTSPGQGIPGSSAEDDFAAKARDHGFEIVGQHLRVNSPFGQRDYDVVIRDPVSGRILGVEVKSSVDAFLRNDEAARQQFAADRWLNREGGLDAIGKGKGIHIDEAIKILWELR